ncbi:hypothetical protein ALI22I_26025 [Saccharothrix sp. ALI-22-I]|uniref:hypothetical protein n=1 Tax=Saccharothrix sp. ALI-22-I TaxID=1933778 RepID=UPI00097BE3D8|nr:hypothetical protein [Saccharothrix sp. ALI-22-I]ONI86168.1 hypothetical protein ALI22I_26025 [Saccharothrix sp. ALI-22-I]
MLKKIGAASAIAAAMLLLASPANAQVSILPITIEDSNVNFCHNDIVASAAAITIPLLGAPEAENTEGGDCTVWEDVNVIVDEDDDDHGHKPHGHGHGHGHGHHDNDD